MSVFRLIRSAFQAGRHQATKGDGLAKLVADNSSSSMGDRLYGALAHSTYGAGRIVDAFVNIGKAPLALVTGTKSAAAFGAVGSLVGLAVLYVAMGVL